MNRAEWCLIRSVIITSDKRNWMTAKSIFLLLVSQKVGLFSCPITGARLQHFIIGHCPINDQINGKNRTSNEPNCNFYNNSCCCYY